MRRSLVVTVTAVALSAMTGTATADSTVPVRGLAFPSANTYLTYFGCVDLYHADTRAPQVRIGGEGVAPAGRRSFGLRMPGSGTASGPVHRVESVAATTVAGFSARADAGSTGVAYVWYVAPGLEQGQVWSGRATLRTGPSWGFVDTRSAPYQWTRYEAATGAVLEDAGTATIAAFTETHGDGPGYLLAGFGCDGAAFQIDALKYGAPGTVTTYDLEGITVSTAIAASHEVLPPDGQVTLTGTTVDGAGARTGASLLLQAKEEGQQAFRTVGELVLADPDGSVRTTVNPTVTTEYRWFRPESGMADEGWSPVTKVVVRRGPR